MTSSLNNSSPITSDYTPLVSRHTTLYFCRWPKHLIHKAMMRSIWSRPNPWSVIIQSLKFSEPFAVIVQLARLLVCIQRRKQKYNIMYKLEVTLPFFPRLIDRCRKIRKALSYKPVGQFGLTLIGLYILYDVVLCRFVGAYLCFDTVSICYSWHHADLPFYLVFPLLFSL